MLLPMPAKSLTPDQPPAETPHYHGHRMRLRERFRGAGADALSDYEPLEMVLRRGRTRARDLAARGGRRRRRDDHRTSTDRGNRQPRRQGAIEAAHPAIVL